MAAFGGCKVWCYIADIAAPDVKQWFASLHKTRVAADRSAPILSVIMRQAEVYGYRPEGTNPCAGHQAIPPPGAGALPVDGGTQHQCQSMGEFVTSSTPVPVTR